MLENMMRMLRFAALLFGSIALVAAFVTGWQAVTWSIDARHLAEEGETAQAEVVEKYTISSTGQKNAPDGNPRLFLVYRFETPDGRTVDRSEEVGRELYDGVDTGGRVDVRYWLHDPDVATIHDRGLALLAATARKFALIAAAIAAALLGFALWPWISRRRY